MYKNYVDVWGFLISYIPMIEIMNDNKLILDDSQKILFFSLQQILIKYLYTPKIKMLDTKSIAKDLKNINTSLKKFSKTEYEPPDVKSHLNSSITESPMTIM